MDTGLPNTEFSLSLVTARELISQLPGLIGWKTEESEYLWCNNQGAKQLGFKASDETVGIRDDQIRCPAAECAESFVKKDKETLGLDTEIETLDINTWADGKRLVSYSRKKTFYYTVGDGIKKKGILFISNEVTNNMLLKLAHSLNKNIYGNKINKESICYEIKDDFMHLNLTERECECLFFLSRGYTTKVVGKLLGVSPRTIETHIDKIKLKLNIRTKHELIDFAHNSGLIVTIPKTLLPLLISSAGVF